jgi:hypothetical protein
MSQTSSQDSVPTRDAPSENVSPAEARLAALAEGVEAEETGLRVVAARLASLPYVDLEATVEIREARQFNVLEAFILRAAHELQPAPTLDGLAAMLGLDPLFVHASWKRLAEMGAVTLLDGVTPRLTTQGEDYYLQGQLPPSSSEAQLSLRYWAVSDQLVVLDPDAGEVEIPADDVSAPAAFPGYVVQGEREREVAAGRALTDLKRLIAATEEGGLGLHQPEDGLTIHTVSSWQAVRAGVAACAVLVVQETLATGIDADTVMLRAVDTASGRRFFDVEAVLKRWMAEGRVTLRDLLGDQLTDVAL